MERSRSPSLPTLERNGSLANLPVWTQFMGMEDPQPGQSQQANHPETLQRHHGSSGVQVPPGHPPLLGPPQPTGAATSSRYSPYGPNHVLLPVPLSPQVQGIGLAGVVQTFPFTPPTWKHSHTRGPGLALPHLPGQYTTCSSTPVGTTSRSSPVRRPTQMARTPYIPMGQSWKQDLKHYDNQKVNGLDLPRTIRTSSWTQSKDIAGCDPLSKFLYQGSENTWLRKLASGREIYLATMGEMNQVVFVSEILSQLLSRGLDLEHLAQHKASQDGYALESREAIHYFTKLLVDLMQRWDQPLHLAAVTNARLLNYRPNLLLWKPQQTLLRL